MFSTRSTALAVVATLSTCAIASANHIDFMADGNFSLVSGSTTAVSASQSGDPGNILGGTRLVTVARNEGFGGNITVSKTAGNSYIDVVNDTLAAGIVTLDYDGFDNSNFAAQWNRIDVQIPLLANSPGDGEFDGFLTIVSSAGSGTLATGRIEATVTGGSTVLSFPFTDPSYSAVDFTDVDRVTLTIDTRIIGTDLRIGPITREGVALPEPATLGALAMGGLLLRRRRA